MSALFTQTEASVIPMRDYQQKAHDIIWERYSAGVRHQLVSMATGSGKTHLASHVIRSARARGFERAVFMVHRDELVKQSVDSLQNINPNLSVGVVKANRDELGGDIIVVSAQTLAHTRRLERLRGALHGDVLFVSDECHHDMGPTRKRAIEALDPALLVGLTATPNRGDKVGLDAIYEEIVFHLPMLDLIAINKLARLRGLRIDTESDLDSVHVRAGQFAEDELADVVDTESRNRLIVESYLKHASERKKTVAFCVNVAHAKHLVEQFRSAGVHAESVFGETPAEERQRILKAFSEGEIPVLVNVMVLSEGYDEPGIDCVLWCRPTQSQALYIQCIGRAARKAEDQGKTDALIVDFVDSSSRHKLITLPSLAGEDAHAPGEPADPREQGELFDLLDFAQTKTRLRERAAVAVNLFAGSEYVWRTLGGYHVAPAGKGMWLALRPEGNEFVPCMVERDKSGAILKPLFDRPLDIETAMGVAESRMEANPLTSRGAGWRTRQEPPSLAQLDYARKMRIPIPGEPMVAFAAGFTKARVSELIDEKAFERAIRAALKEAK